MSKGHLNSIYLDSDGEERLKHSLLMVHQVAQHTLLPTYEKMDVNVHISDSKAKPVAKDADKRQRLDAAYLLEVYLGKSILNNSRKCLVSTVT